MKKCELIKKFNDVEINNLSSFSKYELGEMKFHPQDKYDIALRIMNHPDFSFIETMAAFGIIYKLKNKKTGKEFNFSDYTNWG